MHQKYAEIVEGIQKTFEMASGLKITKEVIPTEAEDFKEMMDQLKEKMDKASKADQHLIISILPKSWPAFRIQNEFAISYHFAESVKKAVTERGILAPLKPRSGRSLAEGTAKLIEEFYISDEVSRVQPGMKDFVRIYINGEKITVIKFIS